MEYTEARHKAEIICTQLMPWCDKIKICGSIRRKKPECHDIDIVLIPKTEPIKDLFGMVTGHQRVKGFIDTINQWEKIRGDATGKYTQRLYEGVNLEIAIAQADNFGNIVLIRTGNADFSKLVVTIALRRGLQQKDGYLWKDDKKIPLYSEEDYFRVLDIPFITPEKRDGNAYGK